jgi:hypothetical protein
MSEIPRAARDALPYFVVKSRFFGDVQGGTG